MLRLFGCLTSPVFRLGWPHKMGLRVSCPTTRIFRGDSGFKRETAQGCRIAGHSRMFRKSGFRIQGGVSSKKVCSLRNPVMHKFRELLVWIIGPNSPRPPGCSMPSQPTGPTLAPTLAPTAHLPVGALYYPYSLRSSLVLESNILSA